MTSENNEVRAVHSQARLAQIKIINREQFEVFFEIRELWPRCTPQFVVEGKIAERRSFYQRYCELFDITE